MKSTGVLYWGGSSKDALDESDGAGNLTSEYVFFNGKRVARRVVATGAVFYYFADHLGSSNVITDAGGVRQAESDFYPYGGEIVILADSTNNHYKFTGKERDPETGVDYFFARYYSSALGRFLTPDWSATPVPVPYASLGDPQSLNLYSYVENNPITGTDPDGHMDPRRIAMFDEGRPNGGGPEDGILDPQTMSQTTAGSQMQAISAPDPSEVQREMEAWAASRPPDFGFGFGHFQCICGGHAALAPALLWDGITLEGVVTAGATGLAGAAVVATAYVAITLTTDAWVGRMEDQNTMNAAASANIALMAANTRQSQKVIKGLLGTAQTHLGKLGSSDPNDPNRGKWKQEARAALDKAKQRAGRLSKGLQEQVLQQIKTMEGQLSKF